MQFGQEALSVVAAPEHSTVVSSCPAAGRVVRTPSGVAVANHVALVETVVVPGVAAVVGMHYKRGCDLC